MKKILGALFILILVFYHLYPKALPIFGYSFIFSSGILGLGVALFTKKIYSDMVNMAFWYLPFILWGFVCLYVSNMEDSFLWDNTKSQIAWIFSAYFVVVIFFKVHPHGNFMTLLYYIIFAVLVQSFITLAMSQNPAVNDFFTSIQMEDVLESYKRESTEGERLLGYGMAFFGYGIISGAALILLAYVITKNRFNLFALIFWAVVYTFIFFIGLLAARTTLVGCALSLVLTIIVVFWGKGGNKSQLFKFLAIISLLSTIGSTLCYVYFPEFADWAFEVFINYSESGEIRTSSSDGLKTMFLLPDNLWTWIFGWGHFNFWGTDVGFTRILFFVGLPGTFAIFYYETKIGMMSVTKDFGRNFLLIIFGVYTLALNVKGYADLSFVLYFFAFYFMHYKYEIYLPELERRGKFNSTKLRYAVQGSSSRRRI